MDIEAYQAVAILAGVIAVSGVVIMALDGLRMVIRDYANWTGDDQSRRYALGQGTRHDPNVESMQQRRAN